MTLFFMPHLQLDKDAIQSVKLSSTSMTINEKHRFTQADIPRVIRALTDCGFYSKAQAKSLESQFVLPRYTIQECVEDVVNVYDYATQQQKSAALDACLQLSGEENVHISQLHHCAQSYSEQA